MDCRIEIRTGNPFRDDILKKYAQQEIESWIKVKTFLLFLPEGSSVTVKLRRIGTKNKMYTCQIVINWTPFTWLGFEANENPKEAFDLALAEIKTEEDNFNEFKKVA